MVLGNFFIGINFAVFVSGRQSMDACVLYRCLFYYTMFCCLRNGYYGGLRSFFNILTLLLCSWLRLLLSLVTFQLHLFRRCIREQVWTGFLYATCLFLALLHGLLCIGHAARAMRCLYTPCMLLCVGYVDWGVLGELLVEEAF